MRDALNTDLGLILLTAMIWWFYKSNPSPRENRVSMLSSVQSNIEHGKYRNLFNNSQFLPNWLDQSRCSPSLTDTCHQQWSRWSRAGSLEPWGLIGVSMTVIQLDSMSHLAYTPGVEVAQPLPKLVTPRRTYLGEVDRPGWECQVLTCPPQVQWGDHQSLPGRSPCLQPRHTAGWGGAW